MVNKLNRIKIGFHDLKNSQKLSEELIPYETKDFLRIEEYEISDLIMKKALEGKVIDMSANNLEEILVKANDEQVLMKKIGRDKYFIKKRIK